MLDVQAFILDKLDDMKAHEVVTLDVQGRSTLTDTLIICSGTSKRHVTAIAENLSKEAKAAKLSVLGIEGQDTGEWVLVDLGHTIVHVMQAETRTYYQLEQLWRAA